jgi:hypothetical protein
MTINKDNGASIRSAERRITKRHSLVRFVWYKVLSNEFDQLESSLEGISKSCDISETGVGLYATSHIPVNTPVFLEIATLKFNISCIGKVAYSRQSEKNYFRIGVRFVLLPPNDRILLVEHFGIKKEDLEDHLEDNGDLG